MIEEYQKGSEERKVDKKFIKNFARFDACLHKMSIQTFKHDVERTVGVVQCSTTQCLPVGLGLRARTDVVRYGLCLCRSATIDSAARE